MCLVCGTESLVPIPDFPSTVLLVNAILCCDELTCAECYCEDNSVGNTYYARANVGTVAVWHVVPFVVLA